MKAGGAKNEFAQAIHSLGDYEESLLQMGGQEIRARLTKQSPRDVLARGLGSPIKYTE